MSQVPELAGFWLMTLFQLILTTYLLVNVNSIILPIEIVAGVPLFGFLALEVLVGFRALQVIINASGIVLHVMYLVPVSMCCVRSVLSLGSLSLSLSLCVCVVCVCVCVCVRVYVCVCVSPKVMIRAQSIKFQLTRHEAVVPVSINPKEEMEMETLQHLHKE